MNLIVIVKKLEKFLENNLLWYFLRQKIFPRTPNENLLSLCYNCYPYIPSIPWIPPKPIRQCLIIFL